MGNKFTLAIDNRERGIIPIDISLLSLYGGECTTTLEGIDKFTCDITKELLRISLLESNCYSEEEINGEFVIISISNGKYLKDRVGPIFDVPKEAFEDQILTKQFIAINMDEKTILKVINFYSRYVISPELEYLLDEKRNTTTITSDSMQKIPYYEKRILIRIFQSYFNRKNNTLSEQRKIQREALKKETIFDTFKKSLMLIFKPNKKDSNN